MSFQNGDKPFAHFHSLGIAAQASQSYDFAHLGFGFVSHPTTGTVNPGCLIIKINALLVLALSNEAHVTFDPHAQRLVKGIPGQSGHSIEQIRHL